MKCSMKLEKAFPLTVMRLTVKTNHQARITSCCFCLCREEQGVRLPDKGRYATGMLFLDKATHSEAEKLFTELAATCALKVRESPHTCAACMLCSLWIILNMNKPVDWYSLYLSFVKSFTAGVVNSYGGCNCLVLQVKFCAKTINSVKFELVCLVLIRLASAVDSRDF